jgi:hypothetical protein
MRLRSAFIMLSIASSFAVANPQQKPEAEIREIKAIGCVRQAAQGHCLLLETLDGETTYSFIAAPRPDLGTVITIQGKPHQGRSACKQGVPMDITDWEPTGDKCVAPAKK